MEIVVKFVINHAKYAMGINYIKFLKSNVNDFDSKF